MFRTELITAKEPFSISHQSKVLTVGSCFSENIGRKLEENKFNVSLNPFGTLFNPISIFKALSSSIDNRVEEQGIVQSQNIYSHFDFHSKFSSPSKEKLIENTQKCVKEAHDLLPKIDILIITFGTSIVYKRIENNSIVANCHKIPSKEFNRQFLTQEEIVQSFTSLMDKLKSINPQIKVVLTLSPVRHLKEGFIDNSISKAILRTSIQHVIEKNRDISYFPSYELLLDDLRDYRFYKEDLVHPNDQAIEYIWEKFSLAYFTESTKDLNSKWTKILKSINHKPFHDQSDSYKLFLKDLLKKLITLENQLDVSEEIYSIKEKISNLD